MSAQTGLGGVVLCGGQSSRMGTAKAWLPFGGEPLLCRVVRVVAEVASPVVVVAAPDQDVPALPEGVELVRDPVAGRGPLQGLIAGLTALEGRAVAAYLTSCDVPFLRAAFIRRVWERLGDAEICVPRVGGFFQTMAAVYRVTTRAEAVRILDDPATGGRPGVLFSRLQTRTLSADELRDADPDLVSLQNVNTPTEYQSALSRL